MNKKNFNDLVESIRQAGRIKRGLTAPSRVFRFEATDVKSIRRKLRVSQAQFANLIGVTVNTLQNWEQGRRRPTGPARALLRIADRNPRLVLETLHKTA